MTVDMGGGVEERGEVQSAGRCRASLTRKGLDAGGHVTIRLPSIG